MNKVVINSGNMDEISKGHWDEEAFKEAMRRVHELRSEEEKVVEKIDDNIGPNTGGGDG